MNHRNYMNQWTIYDWISASLLLTIMTPWVMFLIYGCSFDFIIIAAGFLVIEISTSLLKHYLGTSLEIYKRPYGAYNCSLFNQGGNCEGEPGFPSGHVGLATSFIVLTFLALLPRVNTYVLTAWVIVGLLYILAVAISRIKKKCHTHIQSFAGFVHGFVVSVLWWMIAKYIIECYRLN